MTPTTAAPQTRSEAELRPALLDAATRLFAEAGPEAVSIRAVAEAAGCSHTLIGRYFGSKAGLQRAVVDRIGDRAEALTTAWADREWQLGELLELLRANPVESKLLVRAALGQFPHEFLDRSLMAMDLLTRAERRRGGDPAQPTDASRIAVYVTLMLVLGRITLDEQNARGSRLQDVTTTAERDRAIVETIELVTGMTVDGSVELVIGPARRSPRPATEEVLEPRLHDRDESEKALITSTIELYASLGDGSLTTRAIARRAGVNQGLIYHYFGSRDALISHALEIANDRLENALFGDGRIDLTGAARALPDSLSVRMLARLEVDGLDHHRTRNRYPLYDAVFAQYNSIPTGPVTDGLADPRMAVLVATTMLSATAIWDHLLREILGIPIDADLSGPIAAIGTRLFALAPMS